MSSGEVIPWRSCSVVCGFVVKRGPRFLAGLEGGSGLWRCARCEVLPLPWRWVRPCRAASSLSLSLGLAFPVECALWVSWCLCGL